MSEEEYSPVDSKASWVYPGEVKPRKDCFQNVLHLLLLAAAVFLLYLAWYDYYVKGSHSSLTMIFIRAMVLS